MRILPRLDWNPPPPPWVGLLVLAACSSPPPLETGQEETPFFRDVTLYTHARGDDQGEGGRVLALDEEGAEVWRYQVPEAQNPPGTVLLDVDTTSRGTLLYTVAGVGIFEVDRKGGAVWSLADTGATHDVDRLPNGNTLYTRGFAPRGEPVIVEVDPEGRTVWSWDGLQVFPDEPYTSLVDETGGWMHANGVQRLDDGNTLVCCRNFNALLELDPGGQVVGGLTFDSNGSETSVPTEGTIMGDSPADCRLAWDTTRYLVALRRPFRIMEIDRSTLEIAWQWYADDAGAWLARTLAGLPDERRLLATPDLLVELDEDGDKRWQVAIPDAGGEDTAEGVDEDRAAYRVLRFDADGVQWGG